MLLAQLRSLILRPTPPPVAVGVVVATSLIVAETLVVYPLKQAAPADSLGVIYLLGVVVVAIRWGFRLAAATSLASALAFDYFHIPPPFDFTPAERQDCVVLVVFLAIALAISTLAELARSRAAEVHQRRRETSELAKQQAALRQVATLVARGVDPSEVFAAVAKEMARCLDVIGTEVIRYDGSDAAVILASYNELGRRKLEVGERLKLEGDNVAAMVLNTASSARMDNYEPATGSLAARVRELGIRSVAAAPVIVDGRVWGAALVGTRGPELPLNIEKRIGDFADLVATAIANAATRAELQASRDNVGVLAEQQAALRRVATLVARGARPSEVYSAVADEIVRCLNVDTSGVWRYESDDAITLAAGSSRVGSQYLPVGERLTIEGDNLGAMVLRTGRAARHDKVENATGSAVARMRELRIREGVGAPIIVDGRIWGLAIAATTGTAPMPPDSEERIGDFADLVGTAIANAATRAELIASRARIVAAADDARRRLERDLHDGAQQRLVSLALQLRLAEARVPTECAFVRDQLSDAVRGLTGVLTELQEISRGIHPAILSDGGVGPALKMLARRCSVPVTLDLAIERRLPESVEVGAYYVAAEALTNAAKHARASEVHVCAETDDATLTVLIRDDGVGGADPCNGSGLIGLIDRVEALGGHMKVVSPSAVGTTLHITIPL
jgi:signal transduction histidine kinase